jgi:transcriptional regulator with XRE-family HTH domain
MLKKGLVVMKPEKIGDRIKRLREEKGIMQKYINQKLNLSSSSTLSSWENNRFQPSIEHLNALADILNVSVQYLIYGAELTNEQKEFLEKAKAMQDIELNELFTIYKIKYNGVEINQKQLTAFLEFMKIYESSKNNDETNSD